MFKRLFPQLLIPLTALLLGGWLSTYLPVIAPVFWVMVIAWGLSRLLGNPWWWHVFHVGLFPLVIVFRQFQWSPAGYLLAFVITMLFFAGVIISRVPLYFSGDAQIDALSVLIESMPKRLAPVLVDLGAGIGSAVAPLAQRFPEWQIKAYEIAPMTYAIGRFRCLKFANTHWHWQRFESADLSNADVVYAFLSPEPMPALWEKARQEMRSGALLVSNSFEVPSVTPTAVLLAGSIHPLYVYQIP